MRMLSLFLLCLVAAGAHGQEAADLKRAREFYNAAVERAVKPLTDTYLKELQRLRGSYGRSGMQKELAQVDAEIQMITEKLAALNAGKLSGGKAEVFDQTVDIPANDPNGYLLGPLYKGDTVTFQYVKGMWKDHGRLATENPDSTETETGDRSRLVIAAAATNGTPGRAIYLIPPGTKAQPFVLTVSTDVETAVLRINENSNGKTNPGAVTYRVKVAR